jgi:hypothetical protein
MQIRSSASVAVAQTHHPLNTAGAGHLQEVVGRRAAVGVEEALHSSRAVISSNGRVLGDSSSSTLIQHIIIRMISRTAA